MRAVRSTTALSLIEVLIASSILSVLMVFIFNLFPGSIFALRRAEHATTANIVATSLLDDYRTRNFSRLVADAGTTQTLPAVSSGGTQFIPTVEVVQHAPGLVEVKVAVAWKMRQTRQVVHGLYITKIDG
jgi:type II secretory pathway pseudopilin PulG